MSQALDDTILAMCEANAVLQGVLADDPNFAAGSGHLAVFPATLSEITSPVYPCLTFREHSGFPDLRFKGGAPNMPHKDVRREEYLFEAWNNTADITTLRRIQDALFHLFDSKAFPSSDGSLSVCPSEIVFTHVCSYDNTQRNRSILFRILFNTESIALVY